MNDEAEAAILQGLLTIKNRIIDLERDVKARLDSIEQVVKALLGTCPSGKPHAPGLSLGGKFCRDCGGEIGK